MIAEHVDGAQTLNSDWRDEAPALSCFTIISERQLQRVEWFLHHGSDVISVEEHSERGVLGIIKRRSALSCTAARGVWCEREAKRACEYGCYGSLHTGTCDVLMCWLDVPRQSCLPAWKRGHWRTPLIPPAQRSSSACGNLLPNWIFQASKWLIMNSDPSNPIRANLKFSGLIPICLLPGPLSCALPAIVLGCKDMPANFEAPWMSDSGSQTVLIGRLPCHRRCL